MKVLVTGGSGRAGEYILAELAAHGHTCINAAAIPTQPPYAATDLPANPASLPGPWGGRGSVLPSCRWAFWHRAEPFSSRADPRQPLMRTAYPTGRRSCPRSC